MSKPRVVADFERTRILTDLLREKYAPKGEVMSLSHVVIEEVAQGTGSWGNRWADVLALGMWQSNNRALHGYEVKASRADLKKELSDLTKHEAVGKYCDTWTLVAWDEKVLVDGIPEDWGIMLSEDHNHGRRLVEQRKAAKRDAQSWPRSFVCSMVRNAYEQAPSAAFVARLVKELAVKSSRELDAAVKSSLYDELDPLRKALYGEDRYKWPDEARDSAKVLKLAAEKLTQEVLAL